MPTLIGVAVVVFLLMRVVPGDPVAMMIAPGATRADIDRLYALHGLDRSIPRQFASWATDLVRGDLGHSISLRESVASLIASRMPATIELVIPAIIIACAGAFTLAMSAVYVRLRATRAVIDAITGFVQAIPDFLWGLMLILGLSVAYPLFPVGGRVDPALSFDYFTNFLLIESVLRGDWMIAADLISHLVLPALALALPLKAAIARVLKGSLIQALNEDYVFLARAKGYSPARILRTVALPNALISTLALSGVQISFLVGGTVLIEHLFAYPGIGSLAIAAVVQRDLPLIQGLVLTFGVIFILINLAVDLLCAAANPRMRTA